MDKLLERILPNVQKPARYAGGEYGQTVKDKKSVDTRIALCFPDTYEIGMSNLGLRILYGLANATDGIWCERVFAPWGDMESEMRAAGIGLFALESGDPIRDFDLVAFSLGYEMAYTNVLNMLELSGIPLRSEDRTALMPLVIAGGTCTYNPEPLADFVDLFIIGEGEEVNGEVYALYREARREGLDKRSFLKKAALIAGVYVPALYHVDYKPDGTIEAIVPEEGAPLPVVKRIADFKNAWYPAETIVPSTEIVHDRVVLEIFRGCIRGCRFCQAGYTYRPVRTRDADRLSEDAFKALKHAGYDEVALSSLSTSDYKQLNSLCDNLIDWCEPRNISLSLPSLRADNFSVELMEKVQKVRKSGLTFAPEAGTQRLRDVINKNVTEDDLLEACRIAFEGGWNGVKLYFMLGLPTETDEDVVGIARMADKVLYTWKQHAKNKARGVRITVSTSCFIPKPHTPFQWEPQVTPAEYQRRVDLLRSAMRSKAITYNWHSPETSLIEAVLARGDRRLGQALTLIVKNGGRLDAWEEYFSYQRWLDAFAACGIDPAFYAHRTREYGEVLPWRVTSAGVGEDFLWREREAAYNGEITPDCRRQCAGCGAASLLIKRPGDNSEGIVSELTKGVLCDV
jgi:radical SAM family uncharacterized protein